MTQIAAEQKKEARRFAKKWAKDVKEDGNTAPFWLSLLGDVLGMEHPEDYISFEDAVKHEEKGSSLFVDAWIPSTRVIIEQKIRMRRWIKNICVMGEGSRRMNRHLNMIRLSR